jgi:hypothetical protein
MEKILGFIDLLGFSNMVNIDERKARSVLNDFYNIAFNEITVYDSIKGHLFSDSLLAYSDSKEDLINCLSNIYKKCLLKNKDYTERKTFFLLPRGALSVGIVNTEERHIVPNVIKDFIISPALVHSTHLEKKIKGSRLLIAVKDNDPQIIWNDRIKCILYEFEAFKYLKGYKYKDVLWFDYSNDPKQNQHIKGEIVDLIDISIQLIRDNENSKELIQHIWTLRIGLLSYAKFLREFDDIILVRITKEFLDDKYWLIWETLIEIIVTTRKEWKYAANKDIVDFYKAVSLKKGWANLIKDINDPNQLHLYTCFNTFINELNIKTLK